MTNKLYINLQLLSEGALLRDATEGELRLLLSIIASGGNSEREHLASLSGLSAARISAALAFWSECGVLTDEPMISEEFEERIFPSDIMEEGAKDVARGIRDAGLRGVIEEYAAKRNKPVASPLEVKQITALYTQYNLSAEYIALYMSHLDECGKLSSANRLASGAIKLALNGIDNVELLEEYIARCESERNEYYELKRLFGIWNRNISKRERDYFDKWCFEFGYSEAIIGEAYDIAVINTGKASMPYMDKLLSDWYSSGAKTVDEVRARYEDERQRKAKSHSKPKETKSEKTKPRYGNFDAKAALAAAINRSRFSDNKNDDD